MRNPDYSPWEQEYFDRHYESYLTQGYYQWWAEMQAENAVDAERLRRLKEEFNETFPPSEYGEERAL